MLKPVIASDPVMRPTYSPLPRRAKSTLWYGYGPSASPRRAMSATREALLSLTLVRADRWARSRTPPAPWRRVDVGYLQHLEMLGYELSELEQVLVDGGKS